MALRFRRGTLFAMTTRDQAANRTGSGRFAPGTSGNRKGRPRTDAALPQGAALGGLARMVMDAWTNTTTGLGVRGRDKSIMTTFELDPVSADDGLMMYRGDPLAARIVELPSAIATAQGYELCIGDNIKPNTYKPPAPDKLNKPTRQPRSTVSDGDSLRTRYVLKRATRVRKRGVMDADDSKTLEEKISKHLGEKGINALSKIHEALCLERAAGGSAILLGANDYTTDLRQPLDPKRVRSMEYLTVLEASELIPLYYYNDPFKPKYNQPAIYQLVPFNLGQSVDGTYAPRVTQIHESRLIVFPGVQVSKRLPGGSNSAGWGDSIFTRIVRALRGYNVGHQSAEVLLSDFAQAVYKIKGLADAITRNPNALTDSMVAVEIGRSICRAVVIDAEEDFQRQSTSMTGYSDTLDRLSENLSAASGIPITLLKGRSPAGMNATGESDSRNFYDSCAVVQTHRVAPAMLRLVEIELWINGEDPESINHSIKFKPLIRPSGKELAEERKLVAEADHIYVTDQVVSREEIAFSRFGGDEWSGETHIDIESREAQEAMIAPPVDTNPEPDPFERANGKPGTDPEMADKFK